MRVISSPVRLPCSFDMRWQTRGKGHNSRTGTFKDYCTDAVAEKLAPMTNSQRNETLNSVVGSKNPKIRFYGGSDSNDFRIACGIAQTNLRYSYVARSKRRENLRNRNWTKP